MTVKIRRLSPAAVLPERKSASAAGLDLYAHEEKIIAPGTRAMIGTGLAMSLPEDCVAIIKDRSGLAVKHGITVLAGVIDADYRGEYIVVLHNLGEEAFTVKKGSRIAQVLFHRLPLLPIEEVETLTETDRGKGAFGSTGI